MTRIYKISSRGEKEERDAVAGCSTPVAPSASKEEESDACTCDLETVMRCNVNGDVGELVELATWIQVGEVGELSEIFQWKGEVPKGLLDWEQREKDHLGKELSDVLLYLVTLSDMCGGDLGKAALRKIELNGLKYPIDQSKGSSKKLTFSDTDHSSNIISHVSSNKVHVELGLCEVMCSQAMRIDEPAKEHKWFPDISELESIFPTETLDHTAEHIYHQACVKVWIIAWTLKNVQTIIV